MLTHHGDEVAVLCSGDLAAEDEGAAVPVDVAEVLTILRTRRLHLKIIIQNKGTLQSV
jgi:hypothetical protein